MPGVEPVNDGSSPLARGLRREGQRGCDGGRIIPARAGFTRARPRAWRRLPDHPRSRGVYALGRVWTENPVGSSPLARGLPRRGLRLSRFPRIIPARAGFTTRGRGPPPAPRDHPRSRGVYPGSSRRARCPPDHPRSRGVYSCHAFACPDHTGSSPLARGLQSHCRRLQTALRIIPARAGFTPLRWGWRLRRQDHPRSRGVYPRRRPGPTSPVGSSPLARGLLIAYWFVLGVSGIIPARAGFTRRRLGATTGRADHPRSRGVYHTVSRWHLRLAGSSPLARGLRPQCPGSTRTLGIIPARAGFTLADPWNPNDEPHYQTSFAFTADLALAPQSSDSVVVSQRSTRTPSEA